MYRLGSVFYNGTELTQYAQRNELTQLLLSPLTQPTTDFPIYLYENNLLNRPIHIISSNMHSVMNSIYAPVVVPNQIEDNDPISLFELLSKDDNEDLRRQVKEYASKNGLVYIKDTSGIPANLFFITLKSSEA